DLLRARRLGHRDQPTHRGSAPAGARSSPGAHDRRGDCGRRGARSERQRENVMNKAENKEPEKADLPKASPTAAPAHINPPANPPPVAEAAPIGPVPGIAPVDPKSVRDLAAQGLAPNVAIQPGMDLKAQRRAAREAR